jgi:hypothetical protein
MHIATDFGSVHDMFLSTGPPKTRHSREAENKELDQGGGSSPMSAEHPVDRYKPQSKANKATSR